MKKYKAIIFDVDGTLVDIKRREVPESSKLAIEQLQEKGYVVIIATGRPLFCAPIIEKANIRPDFFVGSNGSIACDKNGKIIFEINIRDNVYQALKQYCLEKRISAFWKYRFMICGLIQDEDGRRTAKEFSNYSDGDLEEGKLPNAISLVCTREDYLNIKELFKDDIDIVDGGWLVYDITKKGVSKVDGIAACLAYLNITFDECVAFGDSENDLDMLSKSGLAICMGNGQKILKENCDYVTADVDKDGIYQALKKFNIL